MKKNYLSPEIETTKLCFTSVLCNSGANEGVKEGTQQNAFGAPQKRTQPF